MADSGAGLEVQFTSDLAALDKILAEGEQKVAAAASRIEQRTRAASRTQANATANAWWTRGNGIASLDERMAIAARAEELPQTTTAFFGAGRKAGGAFGDGVNDGAASAISRKLASGALKFAIVGLADSVVRGIGEAVRNSRGLEDAGVSIAERVFDGIKSVPIAGAFGELGQALSEQLIVPLFDTPGSTRGMRGEFNTGSEVLKRFDELTRQANESQLPESERQRNEMERTISELWATGLGSGASMTEVAARSKALRQAMSGPIDAMKAREDAAAADVENDRILRENEARDKQADDEKRRRADARAAADDAWKGILRQRLGRAGGDLAIAQQMLSGLAMPSPADFITTATTAIGGYRVGQQDASKMIADNTRKSADLQAQMVKLTNSMVDIERQMLEAQLK